MSGVFSPGIVHTGYSLEFSSNDCSGVVPIFRLIDRHNPEVITLRDYIIRREDLFCSVKVSPSLVPLGFLPLEYLLTTLYERQQPFTKLIEFLIELKSCLPLTPDYDKRIPNGAKLVGEEIAEAGFEVVGFSQYGRRLMVSFGWVFPEDRQNENSSLCLYAAAIDFQPQPDKKLGKGKWVMPVETVVAYLFAKMLRSLRKGDPGEVLSDQGIQTALNKFKWTKVALMTPKQIQKARIHFVRRHPELHQHHRELAKALKEAELYWDTVEIYSIVKRVPKLISLALSGF